MSHTTYRHNSEVCYAASVLLIAAAAASGSASMCSVNGRPVATSLRELPASVQKVMAHRLADRGQPFNVSDAIQPGQERRPFLRLICGYTAPESYIVEREQGGRGYNIGKIVFDKTAAGYTERR